MDSRKRAVLFWASGLFVGAGLGGLMTNRLVSIGFLFLGLAFGIPLLRDWRFVQRFMREHPLDYGPLSLGILVLSFFLVCWITKDKPVSLLYRVSLDDHEYEPGSVIDGVPWEPGLRRYEFEITNVDKNPEVMDVRVTLQLPDDLVGPPVILRKVRVQDPAVEVEYTTVKLTMPNEQSSGKPPTILVRVPTNLIHLDVSKMFKNSSVTVGIVTEQGPPLACSEPPQGEEEAQGRPDVVGYVVGRKKHHYWGELVEDTAEQFALLATNGHNLVDAEHPIEGKAPIKEHIRLYPHGLTLVPFASLSVGRRL